MWPLPLSCVSACRTHCSRCHNPSARGRALRLPTSPQPCLVELSGCPLCIQAEVNVVWFCRSLVDNKKRSRVTFPAPVIFLFRLRALSKSTRYRSEPVWWHPPYLALSGGLVSASWFDHPRTPFIVALFQIVSRLSRGVPNR